MKKILLSAIFVSSFAMSGDLVKCSQAIDMQDKYSNILNDSKDKWADKNATIFQKKKALFYAHLRVLWRNKAEKDCMDILTISEYRYATTGNFEQKRNKE